MNSRTIEGVGRLVIIAIVLTSVAAAAATDLETWQSSVGKLAPLDSGFPAKPKQKCICESAGLQNTVGVLRQIPLPASGTVRVSIDCLVPTFNGSTGAGGGFTGCTEFIPFPK